MGSLYVECPWQQPPTPLLDKRMPIKQSLHCELSPKRQEKTWSPSSNVTLEISLVKLAFTFFGTMPS
jgi:hypothetical protein